MAHTNIRRAPPGRGAGPRTSAGVDRLSRALAARLAELGRRWLEEISDALDLDRAGGVSRGALLSDVEALVAWIVAPDGGEPPDAVRAVPAALVGLRRGVGRGQEPLHRGRHVLCCTLFRALVEEAGAAGEGVSPEDVAVEARHIARALLVTSGVAMDAFDEARRQEEDEALRAFGSTVRHELRNPLGAALAAAQLVREEKDELGAERLQRVLDGMERSVTAALDIVESVTALARDATPDVERWAPLGEVLERVCDMVEHRADEVEVSLDATPDVLVDADRVELLAHNLVENAAKYRDRRRERAWVHVEVAHDDVGRRWCLRVRDNGVGIPPEEQEAIFRRFYRGSGADVEGTGLGLSIAAEAVRQMGGSLQVDSQPGRGTTFSAWIPDDHTRPPG